MSKYKVILTYKSGSMLVGQATKTAEDQFKSLLIGPIISSAESINIPSLVIPVTIEQGRNTDKVLCTIDVLLLFNKTKMTHHDKIEKGKLLSSKLVESIKGIKLDSLLVNEKYLSSGSIEFSWNCGITKDKEVEMKYGSGIDKDKIKSLLSNL